MQVGASTSLPETREFKGSVIGIVALYKELMVITTRRIPLSAKAVELPALKLCEENWRQRKEYSKNRPDRYHFTAEIAKKGRKLRVSLRALRTLR